MRTISIEELRASSAESWSVKDNSIRGFTTKYTDEIKVGDKIIIDNYFTLVTATNYTTMERRYKEHTGRNWNDDWQEVAE